MQMGLNINLLLGMSIGQAATTTIVLLVIVIILIFIFQSPLIKRFLPVHDTKKFKSCGDLKTDIINLSGETRRIRDTAGFWDPIGLQSALEDNTDLQVVEVFEHEKDGNLDKVILSLTASKKTVFVGMEIDYLDAKKFPKDLLIEEDGKCQVVSKVIWVIPKEEGYDLKKKTLVDAIAKSMVMPSDRTFSDGYICSMLDAVNEKYHPITVNTREYHLNMNPERQFSVKFGPNWAKQKHSAVIHKAVDYLTGGDNNLTIEGASGTGKSVLAQMICDIAASRGAKIVYLTTSGFMKLLKGEAHPPVSEGMRRIIYVDQLGEAATDTTLLANLESLLDGPTRSAMPKTSFLFVCTQEVYSSLPSDIKRSGRLFNRIQLGLCGMDEIRQINEILSINSNYRLDMKKLEAYMNKGRNKRTSLSLSEVYMFKVFDDTERVIELPKNSKEVTRKHRENHAVSKTKSKKRSNRGGTNTKLSPPKEEEPADSGKTESWF